MRSRNPLPLLLLSTLILIGNPVFALTADQQTLAELEINQAQKRPTDQSHADKIAAYLQKHPDDARGHFIAGEIFDSLGLQNLAQEQFDECSKKDPNYLLEKFHELLAKDQPKAISLVMYVGKRYPNDSGVWFGRAKRSLAKGEQADAAESFSQAIKLTPVFAPGYADLSLFLYHNHLNSEALKYANLALQADRNNVRARKVRAMVIAEKDPAAIKEELEQLLKLDPDSPTLYYDLAHFYTAKNDWDGALVPALNGMLFARGHEQINRATAQVSAIIPHVTTQRLTDCVDAAAPKDNHNVLRTLFRMRLADVLADQNRHTEAAKQLATALVMNPYFAAKIYYRLGQEYACLNKDDQAVAFFRKAHEQHPEDKKFEYAYERYDMRSKNKDNDVAANIKSALNTWRFGR